MVDKSPGSKPSSNDVNCPRIPRYRSRDLLSDTTSMPSFLCIDVAARKERSKYEVNFLQTRPARQIYSSPSVLSTTASFSFPFPLVTTSSVRNFFKLLDILPSCIALISSTAAAVEANLCTALSFILYIDKRKANDAPQDSN